MTRVKLAQRVIAFVASRPPEARQQLKEALRGLQRGHGNITALHREFEGYSRLRTGAYRIIFEQRASSQGPECYCFFAETRDVVYEQLAAVLIEKGGY